MSKKSSSVSAIDHFFHQHKDKFQIIGHYGLFWIRIAWFLFWVLLLLAAVNITSLMAAKGMSLVKELVLGKVLVFGKVPLAELLGLFINFVVAAVILFRLFRRYVKGDVFSMKNTGFLVALGTFHIILAGASVLGTLLLAVAVVVPSHDVDTPKADA